MPYVSARFAETTDLLTQAKTIDRLVIATDDQGGEWSIPIPHEECQVGNWLDFIAAGGTIEPYSGAETRSAAEKRSKKR